MAENNQLHMEVIRLKENRGQGGDESSHRLRQVESERDDLAFVSQQKDNKIAQLEKSNLEMRQKLQQALQST